MVHSAPPLNNRPNVERKFHTDGYERADTRLDLVHGQTRRMLVDELLQPALLQVGGSVQARGFAFRHQNRRSARGSQFVLQG